MVEDTVVEEMNPAVEAESDAEVVPAAELVSSLLLSLVED